MPSQAIAFGRMAGGLFRSGVAIRRFPGPACPNVPGEQSARGKQAGAAIRVRWVQSRYIENHTDMTVTQLSCYGHSRTFVEPSWFPPGQYKSTLGETT
ncbi:hypothetical protein KL86PLE_100087 [uncultured Pleomorphomonas sp.]|uniref:Uncharacterized protein n=1 Tax=uncultured Pleomorphomonas sp. TaxID=442121 RepID=A0A212L171_9HYPH|nr:hypothetical protein KL86PLE_100087 [uncultured Pleomorphomonas sp.]